MSKATKSSKNGKPAEAAQAQRQKSAARVAKQVVASGEPVSSRPVLDGPAPVAPLTLEQRAQLGDKAAKDELAQRAAAEAAEEALLDQEFAKATASASDAVAAKLKARPKAKAAAKAAAKSAKRAAGGLGCAEACAQLLKESKRPMDTHEMIEELAKRGWWTTTAKKPADVLFGVMTYDIKAKGAGARFAKPEPGKFALAKPAK